MTTAWQLYGGFARQWSGRIGLVFFVGLVARGLALLLPLLIGRYAALRFGYAEVRGGMLNFLPEAWLVESSSFPVAVLVLLGAWFGCRYLERYHTALLGERLVQSIRERLFKGQLEASPEAFAQRSVGKYLLRYSGDLKQVQNLFNLGIMGFARDLLVLLPACVVFAALLPALALPALICIALLLLPLTFLNRWLYKASVRRRDRRSGLLAFVSERLAGQSAIQVLNRSDLEAKKFNKRSQRLADAGKAYFRIESFIRTLIPSLIYLVPGLLFLWLDWQDKNEVVFDPESLSLATLLLIAMAPTFRRTARVAVHWELGKLSMRKLLAVLNQVPAEAMDKPTLELDSPQWECQGLSFGFSEGPLLFQNLSCSVHSGDMHWLESPGGTGKTTLVRLLMGVLDPIEGRILLEGKDAGEYSLKSRRKQFAVVSDAWPLLGGTVFEAISYSRKPAKRQRAQKMLDRVQAGLNPEQRLGLDDKLGDAGNRLSTAQLKLLQYARAFLTRKPFLLLDEPWRGLDPGSEAVILRMLVRSKPKRGTFILSVHGPHSGLPVDASLSLKSEALDRGKPLQLRKLG